MPIISAQHLGKTYRSGKLEVPALRDVTFDVEAGVGFGLTPATDKVTLKLILSRDLN